jgi:hypothetical protein
MKKLYIHCGLHKTGTTALQLFLRNNTERLRAAGIFYPYTGCLDSIGSGHHNIAWQLSRDRRFDKGLGDIEALVNEIGNFSSDILLSSEDFESSFDSAGSFEPLVRYAISTQRELVLIIYVRNQVSYLESLYCEMLRHGFAEEYKVIAWQVIDKNMLSMSEWRFHFDYVRIARYVAAIPNARLIFRNFHSLHDNSIGADFKSILPIDPTPDDESLDLRSNERDTPAMSLSLFYQTRIGRPLHSAETEVLEHLCRDNLRQVKTGEELRNALAKAFRKKNKLFCWKHKVPRKGLIFDDSYDDATGRSARLERLFSFETQCAIREIASLRTRFDLPDDRRKSAMAAAENAIVAWWTNERGERRIADSLLG